jgi:hypothetical protein
MAVPHSVGALHEYRADLVRDLGGEASLSTAELHLVDLAVRDKLLFDSLDAALAERPLPELEVVLLAHGHVDELPGHVPLNCEFVGGDGLADLRDLAPDAVQIGAAVDSGRRGGDHP